MRLRTITSAIVGLTVAGGAAYVAVSNRYRTGEALVRQIVLTEQGIIVVLHGVTFLAPADQLTAFEKYENGGLAPYRVDTWGRRVNGLLPGSLGNSITMPTHHETTQV